MLDQHIIDAKWILVVDHNINWTLLQELGNTMYDKDDPSKVGVKMWVMNRL
jgi:hypothetical protein